MLAACGSDSDSTDDSGPETSVEVTIPATDDTAATDTATDDTTPADTDRDGTAPDGTAPDGTTADGDTDFVAAFAENYAIFDDDEQDACIGEMFVTAIGEDQLAASGLAPGDIVGIVTLDEVGLTVDQDALPTAVEDLSSCGDLVTVSLDSATATPEQTECAAEVITHELAAEQLLVQVTGLEPSAELLAARDALQACSAE